MILPVIAFIVSVLIVVDSDKVEVKVEKSKQFKVQRVRDLRGEK